MAEEKWVELLQIADCPPGRRKFLEIGERELAVFHLTDPDRFVVIDNSCPHAGGNLSAGELEDGCVVVCPWHLWTFNLDSGACTLNEQITLQRYPSKVEGERLLALLKE